MKKIVAIILFFIIKNAVWNKPHEEINRLKRDMGKLQNCHKEELTQLQARLQNSSALHIQENEFVDIVVSSAWQELSELCNKDYAFLGVPEIYSQSAWDKDRAIEPIKRRFREAIDEQYKYRYLIYLYPELASVFDGVNIKKPISGQPTTTDIRTENLFEIVNLLRIRRQQKEL